MSAQAHTRLLLLDKADGFDGPKLLKLAPQLLLRHVVADAPHEERLERVALQGSM